MDDCQPSYSTCFLAGVGDCLTKSSETINLSQNISWMDWAPPVSQRCMSTNNSEDGERPLPAIPRRPLAHTHRGQRDDRDILPLLLLLLRWNATVQSISTNIWLSKFKNRFESYNLKHVHSAAIFTVPVLLAPLRLFLSECTVQVLAEHSHVL